MAAPERILVAIDFSATSRSALDWALTYAARGLAEIYLLHVFDPPPPLIPVEAELNRKVGEGLAEMETGVLEELQKLFKDRAGQSMPANIHRRFAAGNPAVEILRAAEDLHIDLLVMGHRGRSALERFLVGSVTERVLRRAPCTVVVVQPHA